VAAVPETAPLRGAHGAKKKTLVVFSGDLDRVLAAFVIANGAVAMGSPVTLFFTFWGLNALRRPGPQASGKGLIDRMFGLMMPKGPNALKLSQMHFLGAGTALMKWVMRSKQAPNLPDLIAQARAAGVRIIACTMSMEVMGLKREELLDGIELGGVATFLGEADQSSATLFV
jgi:peroxiredoxin family protein